MGWEKGRYKRKLHFRLGRKQAGGLCVLPDSNQGDWGHQDAAEPPLILF